MKCMVSFLLFDET